MRGTASSAQTSRSRGYHLDAEQGHALWHLGSLVTLKAGGDETGGTLAVGLEQAAHGVSLPAHVHRASDEALYVLEGELLVTVGTEQARALPGSFVYTPRGVPHGIEVRSATARYLIVWHPAGCEELYVVTGRPARRLCVPSPQERADLAALAPLLGRFDTELVPGPASTP